LPVLDLDAIVERVMQTSARARVRDELTREIKEAARRQFATEGSAGLSLRAVARELGMVSSAMYRYFPSRDDLLTALIVDAYDAVGSAAEAAESAVRRRNLLGRWLAVSGATRAWALAQPQEYALIFGSPVPGYHPPAGAIDPAGRIPLLLIRLVSDAVEAGRGPVADDRPLPRAVRADLRSLRGSVAPVLTEHQLAHTVLAWTELIGSISFELFGQLHGVISDHRSYFDYQMQGVGRRLGLT
jgi:AcrR family transcriptional regulator